MVWKGCDVYMGGHFKLRRIGEWLLPSPSVSEAIMMDFVTTVLPAFCPDKITHMLVPKRRKVSLP